MNLTKINFNKDLLLFILPDLKNRFLKIKNKKNLKVPTVCEYDFDNRYLIYKENHLVIKRWRLYDIRKDDLSSRLVNTITEFIYEKIK